MGKTTNIDKIRRLASRQRGDLRDALHAVADALDGLEDRVDNVSADQASTDQRLDTLEGELADKDVL